MLLFLMNWRILLLALIALLPPIYLMFLIYKEDKIDKEPVGLILRVALFGALSSIPVVIAEIVFDVGFSLFLSNTSVLYIILENFIGVAMVEEFGKYFAARTVWKNPEFNFRFDGVVYCVAAALGFAAFENVLYVFQNGYETGLVRAFTAIPGHAIDGIFMGIYFGQAKYCERLWDHAGKRKNLALALIVPIILHGIYDSLLSFENVIFILIFYAFIIILDVIAVIRVKKSSHSDRAFYEMKGWYKDQYGWYYMDSEGHRVKGWIENRFFILPNGRLAVGWQQINGQYFYFDQNGMKVTNAFVEGRYLGPNGTLQQPPQPGRSPIHYRDPNGNIIL